MSSTNNPQTKSRTKLPAPMVPRDQISFWSILKNCIGKELYKITMPVVFNEPLTMLQRACECIQYTNLLKQADLCDDPTERMELICTFIVAGLSANCYRIVKPFNPLLYETYEITDKLDDGSEVRAISQQVSHHPPVSACYAESDYFIYHGSVNPKIKFWGRTIEILPDGHCRIYLKRHNENYIFKSVSCSIHNIIVGKIWFEHTGPLTIKCPETKITTNLDFKQTGWFGNDLHRFDGIICDNEKKKLRYLYGKWSDYMKSVPYSEYEHFLKNNQKKSFKIPDADQGCNGVDQIGDNLDRLNIGSKNLTQSQEVDSTTQMNTTSSSDEKSNSISVENSNSSIQRKDSNTGGYTKSESNQSLDLPNSKTLWRLKDKYLSEYYNFTLYTLRMNELTPELEETLPRTDSRYRTDVRKLEEGDIEGAASEKERLEEKQRAARAKDKRFKEPSPDYLFFDYADVDFAKEKFWMYRGNYWSDKANTEKFPDIF